MIKNSVIKNKCKIFILYLLYFIAFGFTLINSGIFWDDWTLFNQKPDILSIQFKENGGVIFGYLHVLLFSLPFSSLIYKLLSFSFFILSTYFFGKVLKRTNFFDASSIFIIQIFFTLYPVNEARIAAICLPYSMSLLMFFAAFFLISNYSNKNIFNHIFAFILFYVSFFVSSFLVIYPIVIIFLYFDIFHTNVRISNIISFCKKFWHLLLLPLLFWIIRYLYFQPTGVYENYNQISIQQIISFPTHLLFAIKSSIFDVILNSFKIVNPYFFVLITAICCSIMTNKTINNRDKGDLKKFFIISIIGIILLILAIFPYVTIGRSGLNFGQGWQSRDQLLIPIGFSLFMFSLLRFISFINQNIFKITFIILIFSFTYSNSLKYYSFLRDNLKQLALIENIKSSQIIQKNTSFIFIDNTRELNAFQRSYNFYELNGMMKFAFKDETRFGLQDIYVEDFKKYDINTFIQRGQYNMSSFKKTEFQYKVFINEGTQKLTFKKTLELSLKNTLRIDISHHLKDLIVFGYVKIM